MSDRFSPVRALCARAKSLIRARSPLAAGPNSRDFARASKELAAWTASDAGLSGPIESFDGGLLHRAADGLLTVRMTLADGLQQRAPSDAATIIVRSFNGLRVLLLLDIDGRRFASLPPYANAGVRELCRRFTERTEYTT